LPIYVSLNETTFTTEDAEDTEEGRSFSLNGETLLLAHLHSPFSVCSASSVVN
jgi:hypothetical protein